MRIKILDELSPTLSIPSSIFSATPIIGPRRGARKTHVGIVQPLNLAPTTRRRKRHTAAVTSVGTKLEVDSHSTQEERPLL